MTKEKIQDYTFRVTNANKTQMIVILYDIGITYLQDGVAAIEKGDFRDCRTEIGRVRNTLRELMNSVDTSIEIGHNLLKLYIFCSEELTKAYLDYDKGALYHVMSVFMKLREAYEKISHEDTTGPVMEHAETVYSGFTYDRKMMSKTVSNGSSNRGILA